MRRALALAAVLCLALVPAAGGLAAQPRSDRAQPPPRKTSLPEMEGQVMCPICGTLLELSRSPAAMRERVFIRKLIRQGRSEQQIKDALVRQYGPTVLAEPEGSGFDATAYLVPMIGLVLAALALAYGIFRWRRGRDPDRRPGAEAGPSKEQDERLERDMARHDL